jgi:hypothetical protein
MTPLATTLMLDTLCDILESFGFTVRWVPAVSGLASRPACYEVLTTQGVLFTRCASEKELQQLVVHRLARHYLVRQPV